MGLVSRQGALLMDKKLYDRRATGGIVEETQVYDRSCPKNTVFMRDIVIVFKWLMEINLLKQLLHLQV